MPPDKIENEMAGQNHRSIQETDEKLRELYFAAASGDNEGLKSLIQAGADVNSCIHEALTGYMYTILMVAAENGHDECVRQLIDSGADLNIAKQGGNTALIQATTAGHEGCVSLLVKAGADMNKGSGTALHVGIGNDKVLEKLIQAGADVNATDEGGYTPLFGTAMDDLDKSMNLLIQAGADVNIVANNGLTALIAAATQWLSSVSNDTTCFKLLLKAGAHINIKNANGQNALQSHIANRRQISKERSMFLLAAGEITGGTTVEINDGQKDVPDYLLHEDLKLCLQHLSREAIRKHLIHLDPHTHLFGRIPQLGLPSLVNEYLLYGVSLYSGEDETNGVKNNE